MNTEVYCLLCKCRHSSKEVEFLNIEEDIQGRDIVTFRCPDRGPRSEPQQSPVFAAPY